MKPPTILVLKGGDDILRSAKRTALVAELVGDDDPTFMVTELAGDDYEMHELVDAAQTPPMFTDRRVVVGRDMERFKGKDDHAVLTAYLADPLPTTTLIVEWGGSGRLPKAIVAAVDGADGSVVETSPGRKLADFVSQAVRDVGLQLDGAARGEIVDWLGDEAGKLPGLLAVLTSTYGEGSRLGVGDIEPFLGEAGGVPPWDLTDAIDRGDIPAALATLHRMLQSGRHPMQLMATLHTHFQRILRLDGAGVRGEKEAAAILGLKGSTFPAKKALGQAQRLGSDNIAEAMRLLARTDLELRGAIDWPDALKMEVLVARLSRLARSGR